MLNCDKTITIYHSSFDKEKREDVWIPQTVNKCSWFSKLQVQLTDKGLKPASIYQVRIPLENAPEELIFTKGDYVALGNVDIEDIRPANILTAYDEVFVLMSYTVNDQCSEYSRHIRMQGAS